MIELVDVTAMRGEQVLLWDIHAVMPNGMATVVTGRAGSGKSSLMRLLRREVAPTQGRVLLDQHPLSVWQAEQLNLRWATLPQRSVLHFPFTVRDVVDLGRIPRYRLYDPSHHLRIVEEAMERLGIVPLAGEAYASLPASDQKRVQLARVLAQILDADEHPAVHWILDEPTAHLDDTGLDAFGNVLQLLLGRNACIVLAIRDPRIAIRFAQQLLVLEGGTLVGESAHATPFGVASTASARKRVNRGHA
jgi:iron complex transport system ATP-binding protein